MHDANGVWNKIWDFTTQKLQQMVDEPYMSRQGTALMMRARVVELDKKQQEQKALLTTLELQVQDLQEQKTVLTAYLNKLQRGMITKVRSEIKDVNKQLKEIGSKIDAAKSQIVKLQKSIKKISSDIKNLVGPMSRTLRTALRHLGVELTMYWSGAFVKLLDQNRYKFILDNLEATFASMIEHLSEGERDKAEGFLIKTSTTFCAYFELLKAMKSMKKFSDQDIIDIERKVRNFSEKYRLYIPGPVTPKMHMLEAHLVGYIKHFRCFWLYSEEVVESAHHWIKLF